LVRAVQHDKLETILFLVLSLHLVVEVEAVFLLKAQDQVVQAEAEGVTKAEVLALLRKGMTVPQTLEVVQVTGVEQAVAVLEVLEAEELVLELEVVV
jgi:hypothetical protein